MEFSFKTWIEAQTDFPGMVKIPSAVREPILKFFLDLFFTEVYLDASDQFKKLKQRLKQYRNSKVPNEEIIHNARHTRYMNLFDLIRYLKRRGIKTRHDLPYTKTMDVDLSELKSKRKVARNVTLKAVDYDEGQGLGFQGQWSIAKNQITIVLPHRSIENVEELQRVLPYFIGTIEHEIMHMLQWYHLHPDQRTKTDPETDSDTDWPVKMPGYDFAVGDQDKLDKNYLATRLEYPAQMRTALGRFRATMGFMSDPKRHFKAFVGLEPVQGVPPNSFFAALKKYRPNVWRQAIKDFYKELDREGLLAPPVRKSAGSSGYFQRVNV